MAITNPTPNYLWVLPVPGANIGSWGTVLNKVFGDDGAGSDALGIDGVIAAVQTDVDAAEVNIVNIDDRVTIIEAASPANFYARTYRAASQSIPTGIPTKVSFDTSVFDEGSLLTVSNSRITVPTDADGIYQIRAVVRVPAWVGSGDDGYRWKIEVRKGSAVVARGKVPYLNDGFDSSSGDVTLLAAGIDAVAIAGDFYEVFVQQDFFAGGNSAANLVGGTANSYFEAIRLLAPAA